VRDLIPLCPNCHAMVHRRRPPLTVEELKGQIRS
jgi:5-methylcytosine-specific restriction protein A